MNKKLCVPGILLITAVFLQLMCTQPVCAAGWKIEDLQNQINARGYQWRAGRTSLSDLSPEEFKSLLTYRFPEKVQMMEGACACVPRLLRPLSGLAEL